MSESDGDRGRPPCRYPDCQRSAVAEGYDCCPVHDDGYLEEHPLDEVTGDEVLPGPDCHAELMIEPPLDELTCDSFPEDVLDRLTSNPPSEEQIDRLTRDAPAEEDIAHSSPTADSRRDIASDRRTSTSRTGLTRRSSSPRQFRVA